MIPHVIEAKHIAGHKVWIRFDDGASGELDLSGELDGPVSEPLQDVELFRRFVVQYNTLTWENGADFAPEFLREKLDQARKLSGHSSHINSHGEKRHNEI